MNQVEVFGHVTFKEDGFNVEVKTRGLTEREVWNTAPIFLLKQVFAQCAERKFKFTDVVQWATMSKEDLESAIQNAN